MIVATWCRRSFSHTSRRAFSLVLVLLRVRCCKATSSWAVTSGARPCKLTCPYWAMAGWAARHAASSSPGTARAAARNRCWCASQVRAAGPGAVPVARLHLARAARRQRPGLRVGEERLQRHLEHLTLLPQVGQAQPVPRCLPRSRAALHRAPRRRLARRFRQLRDSLQAKPCPGQPTLAPLADPGPAERGSLALRGAADWAPQQRMPWRRGQQPLP